MATSRAVTPAIPPLSNIKDLDTRRALEAFVNGWRTRNGETNPNSDDRFITKGELQGLTEQHVTTFFGTTQGAQAVRDALSSPGGAGALVDSVVASITSSYLWRKLGERIDLVVPPDIFSRLSNVETVASQEVTQRKTADEAQVSSITALGARVGTSEAGLLSESRVRTNSDNALATAVNTLWATVGNNTALVQSGSNGVANVTGAVATNWTQVQSAIRDPAYPNANPPVYLGTATVRDEARTEANRVRGVLSAERTIKVDVNGYVAGFGIIANQDMTTGATTSAFGVRADQFFIGAPSGNQNMLNAPPGSKVPFTVLTATDANGNPPGVYISNAMIKLASIDGAYIGAAAVGSLNIAGHAVTVSQYAEQFTAFDYSGVGTPLGTTPQTVCTMSYSLSGMGSSETAGTILLANINAYDGGGSASTLVGQVYVNGTLAAERGVTLDSSLAFPVTALANLGNGTHTITVTVHCSPLWSYPHSTGVYASLIAMSGKR